MQGTAPTEDLVARPERRWGFRRSTPFLVVICGRQVTSVLLPQRGREIFIEN